MDLVQYNKLLEHLYDDYQKDKNNFIIFIQNYFKTLNFNEIQNLNQFVMNYDNDLYISIYIYFHYDQLKKRKIEIEKKYQNETLYEILPKALQNNDYVHLTYIYLFIEFILFEKTDFDFSEFILIPPFFAIFFKNYNMYLSNKYEFNFESNNLFEFFNIPISENNYELPIRILLLFSKIIYYLSLEASKLVHIFPMQNNEMLIDEILSKKYQKTYHFKHRYEFSELQHLESLCNLHIGSFLNNRKREIKNQTIDLVKIILPYLEIFDLFFKLFKTNLSLTNIKAILHNLEFSKEGIEKFISISRSTPILSNRIHFLKSHFPNFNKNHLLKIKSIVLKSNIKNISKLFFLKTLKNLSYLLEIHNELEIPKEIIIEILNESYEVNKDFISLLKNHKDDYLNFNEYEQLVKNYTNDNDLYLKLIKIYKLYFIDQKQLLESYLDQNLFNYEAEFLLFVFLFYTKILPSIKKDISDLILTSAKRHNVHIYDKFLNHFHNLLNHHPLYSTYFDQIHNEMIVSDEKIEHKILKLKDSLLNTNFFKNNLPNLALKIKEDTIHNSYIIEPSFKIEDNLKKLLSKNKNLLKNKEFLIGLFIVSNLEKIMNCHITDIISFSENNNLGSTTSANQLILITKDTLQSLLSNFILKKALYAGINRKNLTTYLNSIAYGLNSLYRKNLKYKIMSLYKKNNYFSYKLLEFYSESERNFPLLLEYIYDFFRKKCNENHINYQNIIKVDYDLDDYQKFLLFITIHSLNKPFNLLFSKIKSNIEKYKILLDLKIQLYKILDFKEANILSPILGGITEVNMTDYAEMLKANFQKVDKDFDIYDRFITETEDEEFVIENNNDESQYIMIQPSYLDLQSFLKTIELESYQLNYNLNIFENYNQWPNNYFCFYILKNYNQMNLRNILFKVHKALSIKSYNDINIDFLFEYLENIDENLPQYNLLNELKQIILSTIPFDFENEEQKIILNQIDFLLKD